MRKFLKFILITLAVCFAFNTGGSYKTNAETATGIDESQMPAHYISPVFSIKQVSFFDHDDMQGMKIEVRYINNGRDDVFYFDGLKYIRMPEAKYYIFEYAYDTLYHGKYGGFQDFINVKVVKEVKAFDDDDLLHNTKDIPYTSPALYIREINECTIFISKTGDELVFLEINVSYDYGKRETYYTKDAVYKDLLCFTYDKDLMFDYIYDSISSGIRLSNVKVIKGIHDGKAWPGVFF
jgi:hypothetical protein